jgi:hypothetical protein
LIISGSASEKPLSEPGRIAPVVPRTAERAYRPARRAILIHRMQGKDLRKAPEVVIRGLNLGIEPQDYSGDL